MASVLVVAPDATVADDGVTVTPLGAPSTLNDTAPEKLPVRDTVTIALPAPVCTMVVGAVALTLSEKLPVGVGVGVGVVVPASPPPHAVVKARVHSVAIINTRREAQVGRSITRNF